jgi:hypothetical protein
MYYIAYRLHSTGTRDFYVLDSEAPNGVRMFDTRAQAKMFAASYFTGLHAETIARVTIKKAKA